MNGEELKRKIGNLFTADGLELLVNYVETLQILMRKSGVESDKQNVVLNGIIEFITEFSSNYENSKINFSDTLILIEEIGSPSEIIQSFDITTELEKEKIECSFCKWKNDIKSDYCEYCGKRIENNKIYGSNIKKLFNYQANSDLKQKLTQDFIDHPYSRSFIISFTLFTISTFIDYLQHNSFIFQNGPIFILESFMVFIIVSFFIGFFLSVFVGLIFGYIFDLNFKTRKSLKFGQNKILQHFEKNRIGGFFLVFIGATALFLFLGLASASNFSLVIIFIWFVFIILNSIFGIYYNRSSGKPIDLSLTQLNNLKLTVERVNNMELKSNIKKRIPLFVILSFLTVILNFNYISSVYSPNLVNILFVLFFVYGISYLLIFNGILFMQLNSWKNVSKIYSKETYRNTPRL